MIRAIGMLRQSYGLEERIQVNWENGELSGDDYGVAILQQIAWRRYGAPVVVPNNEPEYDWLSSSIGFASIALEAFAPGVDIVADAGEALGPEQLPDGAVG